MLQACLPLQRSAAAHRPGIPDASVPPLNLDPRWFRAVAPGEIRRACVLGMAESSAPMALASTRYGAHGHCNAAIAMIPGASAQMDMMRTGDNGRCRACGAHPRWQDDNGQLFYR